MATEISKFYTDEPPVESGFYWVFPKDYPVPQVMFLMNTADRGWCLFASGGYACGMPFTGTYRTLKPLDPPSVFVDREV